MYQLWKLKLANSGSQNLPTPEATQVRSPSAADEQWSGLRPSARASPYRPLASDIARIIAESVGRVRHNCHADVPRPSLSLSPLPSATDAPYAATGRRSCRLVPSRRLRAALRPDPLSGRPLSWLSDFPHAFLASLRPGRHATAATIAIQPAQAATSAARTHAIARMLMPVSWMGLPVMLPAFAMPVILFISASPLLRLWSVRAVPVIALPVSAVPVPVPCGPVSPAVPAYPKRPATIIVVSHVT